MRCSKRGVLIKDGSALERLASVDRAVFDKTGTLTLGTPHPVSLEALSDDEKSIALALARASRHPLSRALHAALASEAVGASEVDSIAEVPGVGVSGRWQGAAVSLGRADNPSVPTVRLTIGKRSRDISFRDQPRADSARCWSRWTGWASSPRSFRATRRDRSRGWPMRMACRLSPLPIPGQRSMRLKRCRMKAVTF